MDFPLADDLLPILKALPRRHAKYLIEKYAEKLVTKPKLKTDAQRLARLAQVLDPGELAKYRHAYMRRRPRFFAWMEPIDPAVTNKTIERGLKRRYPKWAVGEEPTPLERDGPPRFNKLEPQPDGTFLVDLVSLGDEHWQPDGYGFRRANKINHDWILVRGNPTTIEVQFQTPQDRDRIVNAFCAALAFTDGCFVDRSFTTPAQWKALQQKFNAEVGGHEGTGRDKTDPASYSMHAKKGERLADVPKWTVLNIEHEKARVLRFHFEEPYSLDGYPELVVYFINTVTGHIKFPDDISEYAVKRIRDEYLAIAR